MKGVAHTFDLKSLARAAHKGEDFLDSIEAGALYDCDIVRSTLFEFSIFLENQASTLRKAEEKKNVMMMELPMELAKKMETIGAVVKFGWKIQENTTNSVDPSETKPVAPLVLKQSDSVRISNLQLDDLQNRFRKLIQLRTQLSTFSNALTSEFSDETFPRDLSNLVDSLTETTSDIYGFFSTLRLVPTERLKGFAIQTVNQNAKRLGKSCEVHFESDEGLEIDQVICEALEMSLTHILINSLDHGIETEAERIKRGKPPTGNIQIILKSPHSKAIEIIVCDDGRGIDRELLKSAIRSKKLMNEKALGGIKEEKIVDLIFMDGLSTNRAVTETSGRGVGLSAVRAAVEKLGGTIRVQCPSKGGTQFTISLPRVFQW